MSIRDSVQYTLIPGKTKSKKIRIYSLSTCAFCKRARQYLQENAYEFEYIHLDLLEPETRRSLKKELKEEFGSIAYLPFITINDTVSFSGFIPEKWDELLKT